MSAPSWLRCPAMLHADGLQGTRTCTGCSPGPPGVGPTASQRAAAAGASTAPPQTGRAEQAGTCHCNCTRYCVSLSRHIATALAYLAAAATAAPRRPGRRPDSAARRSGQRRWLTNPARHPTSQPTHRKVGSPFIARPCHHGGRTYPPSRVAGPAQRRPGRKRR